jgi:hypothetical protein
VLALVCGRTQPSGKGVALHYLAAALNKGSHPAAGWLLRRGRGRGGGARARSKASTTGSGALPGQTAQCEARGADVKQALILVALLFKCMYIY